MAVTVPPPAPSGPASPGGAPGRWGNRAMTAVFPGPSAVFLGVWLVYPTIKTVIRSFYDQSGHHFVWFDNYQSLFTTDTLQTAIKNNAIWLGVVPALVTSIGLVFAV